MGTRRSASREPSPAPLDEAVGRNAARLERVLMVSPTMRLRAGACEGLEDAGYRLRAAASADDAGRVVRAEVPDVAIVDLSAGDPAMLHAAARIRAAAFPRRVPILALTRGWADAAALRAAGCDRGVAVPLSLDELVAALEEMAEEARAAASGGPRLVAQATPALPDHARPQHLGLATRCPVHFAFDRAPENDPYVAELRSQLERLAIPADVRTHGGELVVSCRPTIAECFALGMSRFAREELYSALLDAYPELGAEAAALRQRIRELEDDYLRAERRAG